MTRNEKEQKQKKLINKIKYQNGKQKAINQAIEYQIKAGEDSLSYGEIHENFIYFEKLAKRYGLKKEFKENGII